MRNIAKINENDRKALFHNTAAKMGMTDAIIEKDFWVCYMLDYLFHRSAWKDNIAFKGGTSLSKAYGLIERFSEDIDLILNWRVLGYGIDEPWQERSNTKQDIFNKEANTRAEVFLRDTFLPATLAELTAELGQNVHCFIDDNDLQTIKIVYPNSFADSSILQEIRLEIGALAAWTHVKEATVTPFGTTICKIVYSTLHGSIDRLARTHILGKGYHFTSRSVPPGSSPVPFKVFAPLLRLVQDDEIARKR